MDHYEYVRQHLAQYQGTPIADCPPRDLEVGDVVGREKPNYIVLTAPVVKDGTVTAMVQHYPDGGKGPREWTDTDECSVPVLGSTLPLED